MTHLVDYLLKEMKDGRLSKAGALELLAEQGTSTRGADDVHPLAQRNTSSFDEQRFSSTLRADSFFLSDHVVRGQKMLPAVCYLEMARAAVRASHEPEGEPHTGLGLRDVTWLKPLIVADARDVHIGLYAQENGDVEFEVYTDVVHAHGRAQWTRPSIAEEPRAVDIAGLRARCDRSFESATAYSAFGAMGLEYGAAHRGLTAVHAGAEADGRRFVVAHVQLPPSASRGRDRYVLHPSVLDCALQASIGLVLGDGPIKPALPFALEAVEILDRTPSSAWVVVRPREAGSLERLDIDVCDDAGRVCVRLKGLATRVVPSASRSDSAGHAMMLSPRWEAQPAVSTAAWPPADSSVLLVGELPDAERWLRSRHPRLQTLAIGASTDEIARRLAAAAPIDHVVWAAPRESTTSVADEALLQGQERGVIALFRLIKALLSRGYGDRPLGFTAITWQAQAAVGDDVVDPTHASVHGLVGSLAKEYAGWKIRLVDLPRVSVDVLTAELTDAMERLPPDPRGNAWAYRGGEWYRQKLVPCQLGEAQDPPYRRGGVYVVIGGAGGIGHVFSKRLVEKYRARIIWIGRREPSADIQAKIDELSALGPEPAYVRANAADRAELQRAYASIKARYGQIHGVVHSAVTLLDGPLAEMDDARFKAALSAKADVCVRIAQVFAEEPLDWVLFFSSAQSFSKVAWQSNYAAGCTFKDAFAHQLGRQWPCAVKVMNWSYWGSVGVAASDADRARLAQFGVGSIEPEEGLPALDRLMGGPSSQAVFIKAIGSRALAAMGAVPDEPKEAGAPPMPQGGGAGPGARRAERLRALAIAALKRLVSRTLGAPLHELVESEPLLKYGLESILVVSLTNELKRYFPQLSNTVFFERQTIEALATYLLEMDPAAVSRWVGLEERPAPAPGIDDVPTARRDGGEATDAKGVSLLPRAKRGLRRRALTASPTTEPTREPVAIIGMSGRYPQARTVEQLWDNLLAGKSCITEVPSDRWDHRLYFDPQKGKPGKSYSKWGGFLDAIDRFDPLFFRISPAEAERLDPQERLFLQEAYACIEDAGYTPATLCGSRRVGVYVGTMNSTYLRHATYWSIANRVSYVCDFQGPSMAVDTACSSSLTAIHLAIEALHSGSCEVAIAGGVHLIVDPVQFTNLSEMNMLSSDDRCKAFGARADGFVDGEGVGAIVLKPLRRAVADGDHIYGVVRGSLVNAGGKTNGYTVPNPTAQRNLIEAALRRANVDPRTISYVEAHGTGTELGDPIEIAGLTQAFASWTGERQYCAIGSLKSNVGHLESAAGIAAVAKVLLQMRHRMLVPSLHSQELNPHIDFARTPFKVQQRPEEWRRPVVEIDGRQQEYPRIAGISSFGAGGANAHLIVEEYCAAEPVGTSATEIIPEHPALIVLSAKSEERLRAHATQLRAHLARHAYSDRDLGSIAYTLQVGREAMDHRIAFTATGIQELEDKLQGYLEGRAERGEINEFYAGQVKRGNEMIALFAGDEELQEAVRKWVDRGKYSKLLELWVNGLSFDWRLLSGGRGRRIPLPTYPFAGERYWIEAPARTERAASTGSALHPLLHANTSRLSEQRFSSTFTGEEFFFAEHVVQGRRILPGVASLEMALTAAEQSVDAPAERCIAIRDAVWLQPIVIGDDALTVHLALHPRETGEIEYSIYSGEGERNVHARGRVAIEPASVAAVTDVSALKARCSRRIPGAQCYELFDALGIAYGAAFRAIDCVYAGEREALARLRLPESVARTAGEYVLHPSLMDAAIQASIGAILSEPYDAEERPKPMLLFALDSLAVLQPCTEQAWAWIRRTDSTEGTIRKLDVDLYTDQGVLCARLRGLAFRVLSDAARSSAARGDARPADGVSGELMLAPRWEVVGAPGSHAWPEAGDSVVWIGIGPAERRALEQRYPRGRALDVAPTDTIPRIVERLSAGGPFTHVFWMAPRGESSEPHAAVLSGLRLLKALLRAGHGERALGLTIVTRQAYGIEDDERIDPDHAAMHGLMGSVAKEYPRWRIRVVDVSEEGAWPLDEILTMPADVRGNAWSHRGGEWYREQWLPCERAQQDVPSRFRRGGVYVVLGGAGRLGEALSEYLIRTYGARVVWIGRRGLDADIQAKIDRLGRLGPAPVYVSADAADVEALARAYREIKARHGAIHGLIHSTLVMSGSDVAHMDEQRFAAGLGAKADVSVGMARVFAEEPLDVVLFYSSIESFERNPRQSNYAAGSVFNDAFARRLSKEWTCPVKIMNWGYLGGGPIPDALQNWLDEAGFALIDPDRAMSAMEELLAGPFTQLAFVRTTRARALKGIELGSERVQHVATSLPSLAQILASHDASAPSAKRAAYARKLAPSLKD
ncbi:SDR family NAD(P)-dependent oxidoreductase [Sorangium sp. So ce429]